MMGPQRKQQMLDDARVTSPDVAAAYDSIKAHQATLAQMEKVPHKERSEAMWTERTDARSGIKTAQHELKIALRATGLNLFDARTLSNFVGTGTDKGYAR